MIAASLILAEWTNAIPDASDHFVYVDDSLIFQYGTPPFRLQETLDATERWDGHFGFVIRPKTVQFPQGEGSPRPPME